MFRDIDEFKSYIRNKKVAFCGIGKSNIPVIEMLLEAKADIIACDIRSKDEIGESAKELHKNGVETRLGKDYIKNIEADIIFRTPGMKYDTEELIQARKRGTIVTSEMELFFDICPCKIIAVTGSDGKTTTTTIISEILKEEGFRVHLGGNIGSPMLPKIYNILPNDIAVIELSSFQLISMRRGPVISVITNLTPNHLDIHKDMTEYINAKKNIFLHQDAFSKTILNYDNEVTRSFCEEVRGKLLFFSRRKKVRNGVYVEDKKIYYNKNFESQFILDIKDIKIPGNHNLENYMAAIAATFEYVSVESIKKVASSFAGVEHRAEFVREYKQVKYYNDSIASSPTRTISGTLSLYEQKIILIAGGYDKKIPFDALGEIITEKVKILVLLGDTADKIEKAVKEASLYKENTPKIIKVSNLEEAVSIASKVAIAGDIVSMSPACASFDLYKNFEERGRHFKELVNRL